MKRIKILFLAIFCIVVAGCASLDNLKAVTVDKTLELTPGMHHEKVISILGKPKTVQFIGDKVVLKYKLLEYYKGFVPYYMIFEKKSAKLISWYADEAEFQRNQMMWMNAWNAIEESMQADQQQGDSGQGYGSGEGGAGNSSNSDYYSGNDYEPDYEGASGCWASAGCTSYDSGSDTYTYEEYE